MHFSRVLLLSRRYQWCRDKWQVLLSSVALQPWTSADTLSLHMPGKAFHSLLYSSSMVSKPSQVFFEIPKFNEDNSMRMHRHRSQLRCLFAEAAPTKYDERKLIGYSPDRMFKVVSQVEDYHKCVKSTVISRNPTNYIECDLEVGFQLFVERYTSKIYLTPPDSLKTVTEGSTLFHHLESLWKFEKGPTADTCWLSFHVDFAFKSPLYKHVANVFFEEVVKRMMGAFIGRCEVLYGPSSLGPSSRSNKSVRIA